MTALRRLALLASVAALVAAGCSDDDSNGDGGSTRAPAPKTSVRPDEGARLAATSATATSAPVAYNPTGKIVADSGFRPETDGFGFENYGSGYADVTAAEMQEMFGPAVCASGSGASCVLTVPAQNWMNQANSFVQGGHCFGFSQTALMMWDGLLDPLDYGTSPTSSLILLGNLPLQARLAQNSVVQFTDQVQSAIVSGLDTPSGVLANLIDSLNSHSDVYTVGVQTRDKAVGHAVTPYAVEDKGNGKFAVLVYDNNFPKITRAIEVDRNANTWNYDAAANPQEQSFAMEGDAQSQTFWLVPVKAGIGIQPCPFCSDSPGIVGAGYEQVSLSGDTVNHSHLVLTDAEGRRSGYVDGELLEEIPGVRVVPVVTIQNWRQRPEPLFFVPRGLKVSYTVDGERLDSAASESLSVIGPGYSALVSDMIVRPGQEHEVQLNESATRLSYEPGGEATQSPGIQLATERRKFDLAAHEIEGGSQVTATIAPSGLRMKVATEEAGGTAGVGLTQIRPSGRKETKFQSFSLGRSDRVCNFRRSGKRVCRRASG